METRIRAALVCSRVRDTLFSMLLMLYRLCCLSCHIGIAVKDVYAACARFEKLGVEFVKTPDGGKMKGLAFIKDPDGYWIEIFNPNAVPA